MYLCSMQVYLVILKMQKIQYLFKVTKGQCQVWRRPFEQNNSIRALITRSTVGSCCNGCFLRVLNSPPFPARAKLNGFSLGCQRCGTRCRSGKSNEMGSVHAEVSMGAIGSWILLVFWCYSYSTAFLFHYNSGFLIVLVLA